MLEIFLGCIYVPMWHAAKYCNLHFHTKEIVLSEIVKNIAQTCHTSLVTIVLKVTSRVLETNFKIAKLNTDSSRLIFYLTRS